MEDVLKHRRRLSKLNTRRLTEIYDEQIRFLLGEKQYGVNCLFVYPPKREVCPNCIPNSSGLSSGLYKDGGPQPFQQLSTCPVCFGKGGFDISKEEIDTLIVLFDINMWLEPGNTATLPDGTAQVIGDRKRTWHKIITAKHVILNTDVHGRGDIFILKDSPTPLGLFQSDTQGRSRWFTAFLTRDGGS